MKFNYLSSAPPTRARQNAPEQPGNHAAASLTRGAVLLALLFLAQISWATTYTVSNTNNTGAGSLRQAITDANANPGADIIDFSVAGTLTLASGLPSITQALTINGTTAPGYVVGTPTFIIDGNFTVFSASNPTALTIQGLDVSKSGTQGGTGFNISASSGTVIIQNCKATNRSVGIRCSGNASWTVTNNNLTTSGAGYNAPALWFQSVTTGTIAASNNLFGGTGANSAMYLTSCSGKIIGDENASPAAHIVIKDTDGLTNTDGTVIYAESCSNLTFDNLDVSKATGAQVGAGISMASSSGTMTVKNCKATNRLVGIRCHGNANWTVTGNDLTTSGAGYNAPALWFYEVTTGTIAASNNLFGGTGANSAMYLTSCSDKIIGDENASPAAHIVIKDTDGLTNTDGTVIYAESCSNLTFDNLDVSKATGAQVGAGISMASSSGTMTVKNCKATNRLVGIRCHGNANWTVTNNNLTTSGAGYNAPALWFQSVTTGTIAASNNLFGGTGANSAMYLTSCSGKIIGDENASPAAHIVIKDTDGLTNTDGTVIVTESCSNLTFDNLDVSKATGAQGGSGINMSESSGTMTVKNCKATNRLVGIRCHGNANWTVTGNDLTTSGAGYNAPALWFQSVTTGTIAASNNLFGGTGANSAMYLTSCSDKIIGDENASPAAHIVIKDTDGLTNTDGTVIYAESCSNLTFDNLDVSKATGAQVGAGISMASSSGTMTVKNCKATNRLVGIRCHGNANWTVTGNDLTTSGAGYNAPALWFYEVTTGTIAASNNLFGGTGANSAMYLTSCSGKIIGDENASPAAHIVIKDTDGLTNTDGTVIVTESCSNLTFDNLDVSKATGAQGGSGINMSESSGTMTVKNCKATNRLVGIRCHGNANWTVTGNDLTTSGAGYNAPALWFYAVTTGTIAASNNLFGGTGANSAMYLTSCSGKIIGDENASPAAHIVIKDTDGLTNTDGTVINTESCSNLTFDNLDVSKAPGTQGGTGIGMNSSSGTMTVKNCKVSNRTTGIFFSGASASLTVSCSAIYGNTNGISISSASSATVLNNNFLGNTNRSVQNNSGIQVNAENNYWLNSNCTFVPALNTANGYSTNVDADPYLSALAGCAAVLPSTVEINVRGNSMDIADGDASPITDDHTDFGASTGAPITRTFTIQNTGTTNLTLGAGAITLSGTDAARFSVGNITLPATVTGPSGSVTFDVTYTPDGTAIHNATVNIASNDCDETPYDFAIRGEFTCLPPTFSACPANQSANVATGTCAATVSYTATATGTPSPTITWSFSGATTGSGSGTGSGSSFNKGVTTVMLTATNPCGAPTCMFTVTVSDNELPVLTSPGNQSMNVIATTCAANYTIADPIGDNCTGATWTYTLSGATVFGPSSAIADGSGSGAVSFNKGVTTVTLNGVDAAASPNSAVQTTFTVTVTDNEKPVLTSPGNQAVNLGPSCGSNTYTIADPVSDNCTGATWSATFSGNANGNPSPLSNIADGTGGGAVTFQPGTTTVVLSATDANSNVATTVQFTVTVIDNQVPVITNCATTIVVAVLNTLCKITIPNFTSTILATDCSLPLVKTQSPAAGTQYAAIHNQNFSVVITVTDAAGNASTCTRTILAKDATKPPIYTCPPAQTVGLNVSCQLLVPDKTGQLVSTDGCTNPVMKTQSPTAGMLLASAPGMTHTLVFTATDGAGNTRTCTAILTGGACATMLVGQDDRETEAIAAPISGKNASEKTPDFQTMPNPFGDELTIAFDLSESGNTRLVLMDLTGQFQFLEKENWLEAGRQKVVWNTEDLPGGAYFVGLKTIDSAWIWRKVMLVR